METDQYRVPYAAKKVFMLLNLKIAHFNAMETLFLLHLSVGTSSLGHDVAGGEVLHCIAGEKLNRLF